MKQRIGKYINVILEKKGREVLTSNLRTIYLMEVEFHFNKNIPERNLMECAERGGNIPKEK